MKKITDDFQKAGFSLVELMVGMGILAGATLGATKVMEILGQQTRSGEILTSLKFGSATNQKLLDANYGGLANQEFNSNFFYEINSGNLTRQGSLEANTENIKSRWLDRDPVAFPNDPFYTSFNFVKKSKTNDLNNRQFERYFSICIPIEDALTYLDGERMTRQKMSELDFWPFIRETADGRTKVRCCPINEPNCGDDDDTANPLNINSNFILATVRNVKNFRKDPETGDDVITEAITLSPKMGDLRNLSGSGFFSYRSGSSLVAHSVVYFSECISKRVREEDIYEVDNCKDRFRIQFKRRAYPLTTNTGAGAADVGNIGW